METTAHAYRIILLDDDRFLLDMYSLKFSQGGHTVQVCLSVDEVVEAIKSGFTPDIVVFDLVMPGKDGFDLLREVQALAVSPKPVMIALTNQVTDEEKRKTQELGADAFIVKASAIPSEVVNMVVEAAAKRHKA